MLKLVSFNFILIIPFSIHSTLNLSTCAVFIDSSIPIKFLQHISDYCRIIQTFCNICETFQFLISIGSLFVLMSNIYHTGECPPRNHTLLLKRPFYQNPRPMEKLFCEHHSGISTSSSGPKRRVASYFNRCSANPQCIYIQAPLACRNFIQLAMEGYHNGSAVNRVIKDFMIQMGDPTGTGKGGESVWGRPFKDEVCLICQLSQLFQYANMMCTYA